MRGELSEVRGEGIPAVEHLHPGHGRGHQEGVVLLNSKAGDFASYSLPRLSVKNWEDEQEAPSGSDGSRWCHRDSSRSGDGSDLSKKHKVKFKTPCLNVESTKTRPVNRGMDRDNGT